MKKYQLLLLLPLFVLEACATRMVPVRIACPPRPVMLPVTVIDGTVSGEALDNAIFNTLKLWEHVHVVEKLGCTRA